MNFDDKYILVFVRQNMFPDKQMVHTCHLGFLIGQMVDGYCQKRHTLSGHPSILLYGVASEKELDAVHDALVKAGIEHTAWLDPDAQRDHDDFGVTGIVSEPITKTQRNKLPRFRQWSANNNIHSFSQNAVVAQTPQEHSPIKREVAELADSPTAPISCS